MHPAVAPKHRYRAENHRQPRSSELLAAICNMAPSSHSERCFAQRRPPVDDPKQPCREEAETTTRRDEPAEAEQKNKKERAAEDAAATGSHGGLEPAARRPPAAAAEESARERLKRHRTEMAGRVRIPDMWGQERLLKDWVDCAVFDRPLAATAGLLTARDALVAECAAAHGSVGRPLRVQNGCS